MFGQLTDSEKHTLNVAVFVAFQFSVLWWEKYIGNAPWTKAASTLDLIKIGILKLFGKKQDTTLVVKAGESTGDIKDGNS